MEILLIFAALFVFLPDIVFGSLLAVLWFFEKLTEIACTVLIDIINIFAWMIAPEKRTEHPPSQAKDR